MRKVIPFKKDIIFNTNIGEINSISLEHYVEKAKTNEVKGYFVVSGDYRITEASTNIDPFEYKLPFDISIDERYDTANVEVDIDNFYYEVMNNKILSVNIELAVDNLEERKVVLEEEKEKLEEVREEAIEEIKEEKIEEIKEEPKEETKEVFKEESEKTQRCVEDEDIKTAIFSSGTEETYKTYKIYLVKENDTLESIMENYEVTRESLDMYNDLENIKLGDKLIIPSA